MCLSLKILFYFVLFAFMYIECSNKFPVCFFVKQHDWPGLQTKQEREKRSRGNHKKKKRNQHRTREQRQRLNSTHSVF